MKPASPSVFLCAAHRLVRAQLGGRRKKDERKLRRGGQSSRNLVHLP